MLRAFQNTTIKHFLLKYIWDISWQSLDFINSNHSILLALPNLHRLMQAIFKVGFYMLKFH